MRVNHVVVCNVRKHGYLSLDKYDLWLACPIVCFQNNIQIGLQKWYLNYYYFLKISHTTAFSLLKSK